MIDRVLAHAAASPSDASDGSSALWLVLSNRDPLRWAPGL